ncbi:MAG: UDP-2,3-diacylglucosamine diphosphatase [Candidatus Cloacimonetes bacterium]|nr:UDP-2,3-diacylglucosamine diphosphatase [Candidatus Cloacimonadota bacterium]
MKIICISDLHQRFFVDKEEQEKLDIFYSFLDSLAQDPPNKLIIAGDLFDVWFEYAMVIPKAFFDTLHKLKIIVEKGTKIIYVAGNHDFVFKDFFQKDLKGEVYENDYTFICGRNKFYVSHGDEYTSNDLQYHVLKNFLRSPVVHTIFGWLHPDLGLKTGRLMSRSSRKHNKSPKTLVRQEKGLIEYSEKLFSAGYNYTIMGHIHSPQMLAVNNGTYINLGDWIRHYSYLEIIDDKVELKTWK